MEFKFKTKPYAHQLAQFERHKDNVTWGLFDDMGTGKTKITIDIAAYKFCKGEINAMLIIAPNHVHAQWIKEQMPIHCSVPWRPWVWSSAKSGSRVWKTHFQEFLICEIPFAMKVLAVNVEAFSANSIEEYVYDYVTCNKVLTVIDEATKIKHNTSKRSKLILKLNKYGQRTILTGTPTAKSPFDLWSMMEFLKANYFDCNFFIFQHRYGIMVRGTNEHNGSKYQTLIDEKLYSMISGMIKKMKEQRGEAGLMPDDYETIAAIRGTSEKNVRFIEAHPEFTRFKRLDELKTYIAKDVSSIRKEDCLDLPPKVYETLKHDLIAEYADKELTVMNKAALMTRLMQIVGGFFPYMEEGQKIVGSERIPIMVGKTQPIGEKNAKLEAIMEDIEEFDPSQRFIIWARFRPELQMLYAELKKKYSCCLYYGGTSNYERDKIASDFRQGAYKIFIGNTATAGFGLDFLQTATVQMFYSNSFVTEDRLQGEDRSHRIGVVGPMVLYRDYVMKRTVDEKIFANVKAGRDLNDYFKDISIVDLLKEEEEEDEDGPGF